MAGPPPRPASRSLAALLITAALAACSPGGADDAAPRPSVSSAPVGAAATTTRGAELRAALTYLLTERVYLVIEHARELRASGGRRDDPAVVDARRRVEQSAAATVEVLAASYSGAASRLEPVLRRHDSALLEHTAALAADDAPAADRTRAQLDDQREELARAVRQVVPRLRAEDVDAAMSSATGTMLEAVREAVAGGPRAPALQRIADEAAWATARLLAVGVSADRDLGLAGSPATELRGRLTGLLAEHVLLACAVAARLDEAGGDPADPLVAAAVVALEASAVSLAELAGRAAPETAAPVLEAWRAHLRELVSYATARAGATPSPPPPRDYLDRLRVALGPSAGALPPRAGEVGGQAAASLRVALDATATGRRTATEAVRLAAADTTAPAALLAAALAERLQLS